MYPRNIYTRVNVEQSHQIRSFIFSILSCQDHVNLYKKYIVQSLPGQLLFLFTKMYKRYYRHSGSPRRDIIPSLILRARIWVRETDLRKRSENYLTMCGENTALF